MKTTFLRIALSFIIVISTQGIVLGQSSTQDSIFYTENQDKRCLECLINAPKKDSIIKLRKDFIIYQESELKKSWKDTEKWKAKAKKAPIFWGAGGVIAGILISILVHSLSK